MTLQQQLNYNWERGFYSVVKDTLGNFVILSTMHGEFRIRGSMPHRSLEHAKERIGEISYILESLNNRDWKIVDTIHPSELMGKGFQVGDKVEVAGGIYTLIKINGPTVVIRNNTSVKDITTDYNHLKPVLPVEEKKEVDQLGNKLKQPVELDDNLVENSVNVDFDSGKPTARVGFLNGKYISIGERDVESRSHICNCGFWDSEKKWGETVYTQQFGDRCVSMSVTNNYVICSKCGQKLRRVAISYLDD